VLARVLNSIEADIFPLHAGPATDPAVLFLHLALSPSLFDWQRELAVNQFDARFSAFLGRLIDVLGFQLEVHSVGVGEVLEEGEQLDDVVLYDDLDTDRRGSPLFVDGNDHTAARDGERGRDAAHVSVTAQVIREHAMTHPSNVTSKPVTAS
jgi:hypothetical protein